MFVEIFVIHDMLDISKFLGEKVMPNRIYNIGICDDGKNICERMKEQLLLYAQVNKIEVEIQIWNTGEELQEYLDKGKHLDVLFLDIELFKMSGMEVADFIRNRLENRTMQIVYISSKTSYMQELFNTQPLTFLVKPITQEMIDETLTLAMKILGRNDARFQFKNGKEVYSLSYGEIMYFISDMRKIRIVTPKETIEFYGKLKEVSKNLPKDFLMIHHSYVVNKNYIRRYTYDEVEMIDNTRLTISKAFKKQVRDEILREG